MHDKNKNKHTLTFSFTINKNLWTQYKNTILRNTTLEKSLIQLITQHTREKNNDNKGKKDIMIEDWETEKIFNQKHK